MIHFPTKSLWYAALTVCTLLTTLALPGDERDTAPMSRIVFSANHDGGSAIFTVQDNGNGQKRLTDGSIELLPKWSPDAKRIAFLALREQDHELAETNDFAFHWLLYVMDADGSNQRRVSKTPVGMLFEWSPDGKKFVFQSSHEDPRNKGKDGTVSSAIYVMNADGTERKRLTPIEGIDSFPAWSPDGKRIVFCSNRDGANELYLVLPEDANAVRLTTTKNIVGPPLWSPDGKLIAVSVDGGENDDNGVWLISTDSKHEKRITDTGMPLSWSPHGNSLLVAQGEGLFVIDRQGKNRRRLTPPTIRALDATFSSDGSRVFYRSVLEKESGIFSVKIDVGSRIRVTGNWDGMTGFSVSPHLRQ